MEEPMENPPRLRPNIEAFSPFRVSEKRGERGGGGFQVRYPGLEVQGSREREGKENLLFYRDLNPIGTILLVRIDPFLDNIGENQLQYTLV
jgi:hypothetical protein